MNAPFKPPGVTGFDVEAARAQFPILKRQVNGRPLVYLDSAASAQKPRAAIDAMVGAMEGSYANVHRGLHTLANEATDAYEAARRSVATFLNAASPDEIVFTKGTTDGINHANIVPWHFLRERKGCVLKFVPVRDDGSLDLDAYRTLLGPCTRMVALTHMSNVTGWRSPGREIVDAAHAVGAPVLLDGSQAAVHGVVDVQALDVDFYVVTGHKLYGPTGIGALYGKAERLAAMAPYQGGGEMIGTVAQDAITYAEPPHRFEAGTPAIVEAIGLGAALDWLMSLDRGAIAAHEQAVYERARDALRGFNWFREIGTNPEKGAMLTFTIEGAQMLDRYGIAVRAGTHCAEPLMKRFGVTASARASFALYNTLEEADAFAEALVRVREIFS